MTLAAVLALSLTAPVAADPSPAAPAAAPVAAASAPSPSRPFVSLQGGEPIGSGGAALALSAGFSRLSAEYLQAWSDAADWGAAFSFDWLTTELLAGGVYRSLLWRSGSTSLAWRGRAGLYWDLGSTWALSANRDGVGFQVGPGLALSTRLARGVVSLLADVPVTVTFDRNGGFALGLHGAAAFETPLWEDVAIGARAGVGALWSTSGAPFGGDSPRAVLDVVAVVTYRLF